MRFVVRHQTLYRYNVPVVLAPHVLRLTPRATENRIWARSLLVRPDPVQLSEQQDSFGNAITRLAFPNAPTDELRIDSRLELDTLAPPLLGPETLPLLPWAAPASDGLAPYLPAVAADPGVASFARAVAAEAGDGAVPFLDHLCRTMHARSDRRIRHTGDAQTAAETLASWQGACRDLTVLFMAAARSLGMAARFCSGYQAAADTPTGQRYLHAWPEVFIPGSGWRGWDPTHGVRVGEGHVALCAAPEQAATMPVDGAYYFGRSITATLDFEVTIATSSQ